MKFKIFIIISLIILATSEIKTQVDYKDIKDAGFNEYLSSEDYTRASLSSGISQDKLKADYLTGGTIGKEGPIDIGSDRFRLDGKETRQLIKDGANNRVLIGKRPDGTFGIDVSQTGYDVTNASSDQLVMSSNFNNFKIVSTISDTITLGAGELAKTDTNSHNLGYRPVVIGGLLGTYASQLPYITTASYTVSDGGGGFLDINGIYFHVYISSITTTQVVVTATRPDAVGGAVSFDYKLYLLRETVV